MADILISRSTDLCEWSVGLDSHGLNFVYLEKAISVYGRIKGSRGQRILPGHHVDEYERARVCIKTDRYAVKPI